MKLEFSWPVAIFGSVAVVVVGFLAFKGVVPKEVIATALAAWLAPSPLKLLAKTSDIVVKE